MIDMRWAIRCVGLASTLILARVLIPQDFGIVILATIEALSFLPAIARLFVSVGIGGAVFVATMLVLWYIAGRPMGVESSTLATLSKVWRRVRATP